MLTIYDEFPVHQTSKPFSVIPVTDMSWDDGYFFGIYNAEQQIFLLTGLRVNPNADMVGGYAVLNIAGRQYSVRFSRCWRRQIDTVIGPLRIEFIEPLKVIRLTLAANESDLSFDITWTGVSPATLEAPHFAQTRGRTTTDQSRYTQAGRPSGVIRFGDQTISVDPKNWGANRDHSWGLYADRKPLGGFGEWLPPQPVPAVRRALRFWNVFTAGEMSGFYRIHESETGAQVRMNDVFGTPFEGTLFYGFEKTISLKTASHKLTFVPRTRMVKTAQITFHDEHGQIWQQYLEVTSPPWVPHTMGYTPGSWKDGGTMHTYHGNEELVVEFDEFDFSAQPFEYSPYSPRQGAHVSTAEISASLGLGVPSQMHGIEFLVAVRLVDPQGNEHLGQGHLECFIDGRFDPYGFE